MSLFDELVSEALRNQGELAPLQVVVEKELLHHDILREMSEAGLLGGLTFIGGTCLRMVYGSNRLSEDLDFTGGKDFDRQALVNLGDVLEERLQSKYNLKVEVSEPVRETGNTSTWKLKVITNPGARNLPQQRIHIDICSVPSYERKPTILRNHYGLEMGTSGLIVQAQSKEEILADKMVAFAYRPNRVKNRDLWDIGWLKQQNTASRVDLVEKKIVDRRRSVSGFVDLLKDRSDQLSENPEIRSGFIEEMRRFLPPKVVFSTIEKKEFWAYLTELLRAECAHVIQTLNNPSDPNGFEM